MLDQLYHIVFIGKYILIGLGIIGFILLLVGIYRKDKNYMTRGGYIIILSIVLGICGYFIFSSTKDKAYQMMDNTYIRY